MIVRLWCWFGQKAIGIALACSKRPQRHRAAPVTDSRVPIRRGANKRRRGLIAAALQFGRMVRSLARAAKLVEARALRGRQCIPQPHQRLKLQAFHIAFDVEDRIEGGENARFIGRLGAQRRD